MMLGPQIGEEACFGIGDAQRYCVYRSFPPATPVSNQQIQPAGAVALILKTSIAQFTQALKENGPH